MTEKLIKQRAPAEPPASPMPMSTTLPAPRDQGRMALIVGPAIGFVLAASLAISFALALAGGAGAAALGIDHGGSAGRMAVFVL